MNTSNTVEIITHQRFSEKVRRTFLESSGDERLKGIKVSVPENMGADGLREGTYDLIDVFKLIAGDIEADNTPVDTNTNDSLISDPTASSKLVLEETYELLYMIAKTPWLKNANVSVKEQKDEIFIPGKYSFTAAIQALGYLVEDAYHAMYEDDEEEVDE